MTRICVFCGSTDKLTREHIFPMWLLEHLNVANDTLYVHWRDNDEPERTMTYKNLTAKKYCARCNNGWMAQLESRVKPLLIEMLESKASRNLSDDESQALAVWCIKTAYTLSSSAIFPLNLPPENYHKVFQRIGPLGTYISIAHLKEILPSPSWLINHLPYIDFPKLPSNRIFPPDITEEATIALNKFFDGPTIEIDQTDLNKSFVIAFGFGHFGARIWHVPKPLTWFDIQTDYNVFLHPRKKDVIWVPPLSFDNLQEYHSRVVVMKPSF